MTKARPVRRHGASQRQIWYKSLMSVDAGSYEVIAVKLTAAFIGGAELSPRLLERLPAIEALELMTIMNSMTRLGMKLFVTIQAVRAKWRGWCQTNN